MRAVGAHAARMCSMRDGVPHPLALLERARLSARVGGAMGDIGRYRLGRRRERLIVFVFEHHLLLRACECCERASRRTASSAYAAPSWKEMKKVAEEDAFRYHCAQPRLRQARAQEADVYWAGPQRHCWTCQ